jgi:peroxiredoxin Q/BCP
MNVLTCRRSLVFCCAALLGGFNGSATSADDAAMPAVGGIAKDFSLSTLGGEKAQLASLLKQGPVVLVVLRGYPGYQCPVCDRQVREFITSAEKFKAAKANVVFVYPGAADKLQERAGEFVRGKTLPDNFHFALDPDFSFTVAYNLRWDAKNETAYPSTFVIEPSGKITYAKISKTHGGRAPAADVLKALGDN